MVRHFGGIFVGIDCPVRNLQLGSRGLEDQRRFRGCIQTADGSGSNTGSCASEIHHLMVVDRKSGDRQDQEKKKSGNFFQAAPHSDAACVD